MISDDNDWSPSLDQMSIIVSGPDDKKGNLYIGELYEMDSKQLLVNKNVLAVITADTTGRKFDNKHEGEEIFEHRCLDMREDLNVDPSVFNIVDFIHEKLQEGNVLVQSAEKNKEAAAVVIAYLMKYLNKNYNSAKNFTRIDHYGYVSKLQTWADSLNA